MTTEKLATNIGTVRDLLKRNESKIAKVLPKHLNADRLMEIAMTVVQRTPALAECTPRSLLGSVIQSTQVGLSLDPTLGEAYLVPYNRKVKVGSVWTKERQAQFIVGYRGLLKLARNSGDVTSILVMPVYEAEQYAEAITEKGVSLEHLPGKGPYTPSELSCVYMLARFKEGDTHFGRMWKWEIDLVRARSKSSDSGPWTTDYVEMAKKTLLRREAKMLPLSTEAQKAISADERDDLGIEPSQVIDLDDTPAGDGYEAFPAARPKEHNDPNPAAQAQLDALKADLDGERGPEVAQTNEFIERPPIDDDLVTPPHEKVPRGCEHCGVKNLVPPERETFECVGCGAVSMVKA